LSTKDFVVSTGRDRYWEACKRELAAMQDPKTGLLRAELARPVDCPVCSADAAEKIFVKEGFTFVRCPGCGLVYVNPQLDQSRLKESYEGATSQDIWVDVLLSADQQAYDGKKFQRAAEEMNRMRPAKGKVLDVGCSIGLFLDIARSAGWKVWGLELSKKAVKYAVETLKLDVRPKLLEDCGFEPESFDVLTLWEVLEHVPDPRGLLADAAGLLKPGGLAALLVPNAKSLSVMMMRERSSAFGGRNHLWYFSPKTLPMLLDGCGFETVSISTQLSQIEEMASYLNYEDPYFPTGKNREFAPDAATLREAERFIFANNMGYKLMVWAKKR